MDPPPGAMAAAPPIVNGAEQLKGAPISMLDMRSNTGGNEGIVRAWINQYTGVRNVPGNGMHFSIDSGRAQSRLEDDWVSHDDILILLTGKATASSGEIILDVACNLENSLIIGENTWGAMIGNSGYAELPNSKASVQMTMSRVYITPEGYDYFEEMRGFYPDIWVPAGEAEELAAKLIENLS